MTEQDKYTVEVVLHGPRTCENNMIGFDTLKEARALFEHLNEAFGKGIPLKKKSTIIKYHILELQYKSGKVGYKTRAARQYRNRNNKDFAEQYCCDGFKTRVLDGDYLLDPDDIERGSAEDLTPYIFFGVWDTWNETTVWEIIRYCPLCGAKVVVVKDRTIKIKQKSKTVQKEVFVSTKKVVDREELYWDIPD